MRGKYGWKPVCELRVKVASAAEGGQMEKPDRMSRPDGFWVRGVYYIPDDFMSEEIAAAYRAV